jgi:hypothetical protein
MALEDEANDRLRVPTQCLTACCWKLRFADQSIEAPQLLLHELSVDDKGSGSTLRAADSLRGGFYLAGGQQLASPIQQSIELGIVSCPQAAGPGRLHGTANPPSYLIAQKGRGHRIRDHHIGRRIWRGACCPSASDAWLARSVPARSHGTRDWVGRVCPHRHVGRGHRV